jgi:N-acetylmuramoyl-L-alanine amidase
VKIYFLAAFILAFIKLPAQDSRKEKYEQKIKLLLDKEDALQSFYAVDEQGISIFANAEDNLSNKPEMRLSWSEVPQFKALMREAPAQEALRIMIEKKTEPFKPAIIAAYVKPSITGITPEPLKPLKGLRVALDPGHMAGDMSMARIEKKFLDMKPDSTGKLNEQVQIMEGMLTLQTALLLKSRLEAAGAEVMLTRSKPGESAFGKTFDEWIKTDMKRSLDSLDKAGKLTPSEKQTQLKGTKRDVFRKIFFELELQKRAEKINAFKPDLTVIIHYNVDESNTDWKQPSEVNYNMAFVAGSFMKGELSTPLARLEFLRLIVTDDIESSVKFSSIAAQQFEEQLQVRLAGPNDAKYLTQACMSTSAKGVYARNLTLTRLVHGTLVYGETLCQDNIKECIALQRKDGMWDGITTSMRVKQVADTYYNAIKLYSEKQH